MITGINSIKKVGIFTKTGIPAARKLGQKLFHWLAARGITPLPAPELAQALGEKPRGEAAIVQSADLLITLGGDGTFLHTASLAGEKAVPILGVNLGGLGFLTEAAPEELFPLLREIQSGKIEIEERIRLRAEYRRGKKKTVCGSALNDVVIGRGVPARLVVLNVAIDSETLSSYRADGLIVATPTGSTAYSLSAGGPIIHPALRAITLNPISPHTLTQRPVILPDSARIRITLPAPATGAVLSLDGQSRFELRPGDEVLVSKHPIPTLLVRPPGRSYFQILQTKLHWGTR